MSERDTLLSVSGDKEDTIEMIPSMPEKEPGIFEELILTPSAPDEKPESADLLLEAEGIAKAEEITFDGEKESEARIREAMIAYDKAMDQAADIE